MAFFDSRVSRLFVADSASTSQDISAYVKSVEGLPGPRNLNDVTTFGSVGHRWSPGLQDNTVTIELVYSEDATTGSNTVFSPIRTATTSKAFIWYPSGSTGAAFSGNLWVETYEITSRIGNAVMAKVTARVDNGVTSS